MLLAWIFVLVSLLRLRANASATSASFPRTSGFYTFTNGTNGTSHIAIGTGIGTGVAASPSALITETTLTYVIKGRPKTVVFSRTGTFDNTTTATATGASAIKTYGSVNGSTGTNYHPVMTRILTSTPIPGQLYVNSTNPNPQCDGPKCPPEIWYNGQKYSYFNNPKQHHIYKAIGNFDPLNPLLPLSSPSVITVSSLPDFDKRSSSSSSSSNTTHTKHNPHGFPLPIPTADIRRPDVTCTFTMATGSPAAAPVVVTLPTYTATRTAPLDKEPTLSAVVLPGPPLLPLPPIPASITTVASSVVVASHEVAKDAIANGVDGKDIGDEHTYGKDMDGDEY